MKISSLLTNAGIATGLAAAIISAPSAQAANFTFGFQNILGTGNTNGDAIVGQFTFSIADDGDGKTLWQFNNAGPTASFLSEIFFDWSGLPAAPISLSTLNTTGTSSGVSFQTTGGKLPQGQNVVTLLSPTLGFDNRSGNQDANLVLSAVNFGTDKDGLDPNQSLGVSFNGLDATTLNNLILADRLRIGIRAQGIDPSGGSDAFFDGPPISRPVPVPGFLIGVVAAGAVGGSRLLKNKKQVA
ncbi:hypothetical protein H6F42_19490 [Pseudanabaena sp. FACHB-1998]|uniref:hypothetical protein n=1 Tax=Pseudanabaena sp. FACHB-1998 TaxID=2692858 RepID=UPI001680467A|nr:hypothetical protein [Pseudanabaena sp. FACHB-1998]MBD2179111.1 hypothetical protein [Pseudanabaena sp. FACHB-1998]